MYGCFGGHPIDRWLERKLDDYLDEQDYDEDEEKEKMDREYERVDQQVLDAQDRENYG